MTKYQKVIALTYYSFTTLSTVGLGDYHPRSSAERLICSFVMVIGVSLTTIIIENVTAML